MFPYGVLRQWRSNVQQPYDVAGNRIAYSFVNGIMYTTPFGALELFKQINRLDIYLSNKDKLKYEREYHEFLGVNWNTWL